MTLEMKLTRTRVEDWEVRQAIALGWYDGPTDGFCALKYPESEFVFSLAGERPNPDGLDHRLYRLRELPRGAVDQLLEAIKPLGEPAHAVWAPVWRFPEKQSRDHAERVISEYEAAARPTSLIVYSQDFERFLGVWEYQGADSPTDWFAALGVELSPTEPLTPHP